MFSSSDDANSTTSSSSLLGKSQSSDYKARVENVQRLIKKLKVYYQVSEVR